MDRLSKISKMSNNKITNKLKGFKLSKPVKYGIILLIGIALSPGLILNIPPVDVTEQNKKEDGSTETITKGKWFFSGKTSLSSSIVHLLLFLLIIFIIDYLF
tara:strand:+ start:1373 stop:1678 length:306 start_codon:yes stop_codon:yes gene_type:complete